MNLKNKPDWLFERNPLGLVPVIEYKGHVIYESAICDEFLEDAFPGGDSDALLPKCAFKRAAARLFMTNSDKKVNRVYVIVMRSIYFFFFIFIFRKYRLCRFTRTCRAHVRKLSMSTVIC